jgi:hypothetical protein
MVDEFASDDESSGGVHIPGDEGVTHIPGTRDKPHTKHALVGASTTAEGSSLEDVLEQLASETQGGGGRGRERAGAGVKQVNKADLSLLRESLQYLDMHTSAVADVPSVVAATRRENTVVKQQSSASKLRARNVPTLHPSAQPSFPLVPPGQQCNSVFV